MPVTLREMTAAELARFLSDALTDERLQPFVLAGSTLEHAREMTIASFAEYFPGGSPAPGHVVFSVVEFESDALGDAAGAASGTAVGFVWVGPHPLAAAGSWWVWDVEIDENHRGRGWGRAAMQLTEEYVRAQGGDSLGLNVMGYNTAAKRLYESLGFETMSTRMRKTL